MSELTRVKLSEVASLVDYGHTASSTTEPIGPKFLRITDIQDGGVNWDLVPFCECNSTDEASSQLKTGDIVFARTGATTGKSFLIKNCPDRAIFASYLIRVRAESNIFPDYLAHFFGTPDYWSQISLNARGAAQPGVNATSLKSLSIPLLPIGTQKRIAAILDQAEALRSLRRQSIGQLDALARSVFLEMFGDPVMNPKYPVNCIRPFAEASSGKSSKTVLSSVPTETPIYGGNGVNGWATQSLYDEPILIFGRVGQQCGNTYLTTQPVWVTDNAIAVKVIQKTVVRLDYLLHAFSMTSFSDRVKYLDLPFINQQMILDFPISIPPLALQQEFADRIGAIEALKAQHRQSLAKMDTLFASLQHRAFRGEL
jgi:type I restriction enzyme, S subunit